MAKANASNGLSERPDNWATWVPMLEATKILDVPHGFIRKLASDGLIREESHDGERRFHPVDIANAKNYVGQLPEDEKRPPQRPVGGITHEEFAGATTLVKQVHGFLATMVPLLTNSWTAVMTVSKEQSERDGKRIAALEQMRDEGIKAREAQLSAESERRMAETMLAQSEARKNKAFNSLVDGVGPIVIQKLGLQSDPKIGAAISLMKSLKRDQLELLLQLGGDGGLLSEEQVGLVKKILGEEKPATGAAKSSEKKER
jgi:hypothetical protein